MKKNITNTHLFSEKILKMTQLEKKNIQIVEELNPEDQAVLDSLVNPDERKPTPSEVIPYGMEWQERTLSALITDRQLMADYSYIHPKAWLHMACQAIWTTCQSNWQAHEELTERWEIVDDLSRQFEKAGEHLEAAKMVDTLFKSPPPPTAHPLIREKLDRWTYHKRLMSASMALQDQWKRGETPDTIKLQALIDAQTSRKKWDWISSKGLRMTEFPISWLVKGVMVSGGPCVVGGPRKALKTSILTDLAISLGTGTPFLDKWQTTKTKTLFISGESGGHTIRETALRVAKSKGVDLDDAEVYWGFDLPQLASSLELADLKRYLRDGQYGVVIIDPLYLCLMTGGGPKDKGEAGNVYDMGPRLARVAKSCLSVGCTPILAHHATKSTNRNGKPMELEDLAFSGIQEFARQWLLLNRRKQYVPESGTHEMVLSYGGSAGQGGLYNLDIHEGALGDDFTGRVWKPTVDTYKAPKTQQKGSEGLYSPEEKERREREDQANTEYAFLEALSKSGPILKTRLSEDVLGWNKKRFNETYDRLLDQNKIEIKAGTTTRKDGVVCKAKLTHLTNLGSLEVQK